MLIMRRRLFSSLSVVSLLLCIALFGLWMRSYRYTQDIWCVTWEPANEPDFDFWRYLLIAPRSDGLYIQWGAKVGRRNRTNTLAICSGRHITPGTEAIGAIAFPIIGLIGNYWVSSGTAINRTNSIPGNGAWSLPNGLLSRSVRSFQ